MIVLARIGQATVGTRRHAMGAVLMLLCVGACSTGGGGSSGSAEETSELLVTPAAGLPDRPTVALPDFLLDHLAQRIDRAPAIAR